MIALQEMRQRKNWTMKRVVSMLLGVLALTLSASVALAQDGTPIRVVLPYSAGSGSDLVARPLFAAMSRELGRTMIVDNRPGGNGFIGAVAVARAAPDGNVLLLTTNTTQTLNPQLFKELPYDPDRDFSPVGPVLESPYVLVVAKSLPIASVSGLISWSKANQDKVAYAWGPAISQYLGTAFVQRAGLQATGVPYKSTPGATTDLIGGHISFMFLDLAAAMPQITGGQLRPLAVTSARRLKQLPDVPTMAEGSIPLEAVAWLGLFAPAATPQGLVQRYAAALQKAIATPAVQKQIATCCVTLVASPAEFGAYLKRDRKFWSTRLPEAGMRPQ